MGEAVSAIWDWIATNWLALGAVVAAALTALWTKSLAEQNRRALHEERERHDEMLKQAQQHHDEQVATLRADLEESQRQWEATGPRFRVDGTYFSEQVGADGHRDRLRVTVTNEGRMTGVLKTVTVDNGPNPNGDALLDEPVELAAQSSRDFIVKREDHPWAAQMGSWQRAVVVLTTGTNDIIYWSEPVGQTTEGIKFI